MSETFNVGDRVTAVQMFGYLDERVGIVRQIHGEILWVEFTEQLPKLGRSLGLMPMLPTELERASTPMLAAGDPIPPGGCGCRDNGVPVMRAQCALHR